MVACRFRAGAVVPAEPPEGVVQSRGSEDLHAILPPPAEQLSNKAPDA